MTGKSGADELESEADVSPLPKIRNAFDSDHLIQVYGHNNRDFLKMHLGVSDKHPLNSMLGLKRDFRSASFNLIHDSPIVPSF